MHISPRALLPTPLKKAVRPLLEKLDVLKFFVPEDNNPLSLLRSVHQRIGIGNYLTPESSGESFLTHTILPALINKAEPVIFDVGANTGEYTNALLEAFPSAVVYSFEPSPSTYATLVANVPKDRARCVPLGLSNKSGVSLLYDYDNQTGSQHASMHSDVLSKLHKADSIRHSQIKLSTVDEFCEAEKLNCIDFLKIDTEGNEFAVLEGARLAIKSGSIPFIQFEFNEMNVVSRVFLKDFYDLLEGYAFYRLLPHALLPLGAYNTKNEIFFFQNILALKADMYPPAKVSPFVAE